MICYLPNVLWIIGLSSLSLLSRIFSPWLLSDESIEPWLIWDMLLTWLIWQTGPDMAPRWRLKALPIAVKFLVGIPFMASSLASDSFNWSYPRRGYWSKVPRWKFLWLAISWAICMSWSMNSPASPPAIIFFLNWLMNFTLWNEWICSFASLSLKLRSLTSADSVISDYMENYLLEFLPMVPLFLIFRSSEWDIPFLGSW